VSRPLPRTELLGSIILDITYTSRIDELTNAMRHDDHSVQTRFTGGACTASLRQDCNIFTNTLPTPRSYCTILMYSAVDDDWLPLADYVRVHAVTSEFTLLETGMIQIAQ